MDALPILSHHSLDAPIAYRQGVPVSVRTFLAEASALARALPDGQHMLNACTDRYRFAVTLVAGMLSGRINLMPSTYTAQSVREMGAFAPDAFIVCDDEDPIDGMPRFPYPAQLPSAGVSIDRVPSLPPDQPVAWVFTSGSTGTPTPHLKTWGKLVANTRGAARLLQLDAGADRGFSLLGTVPPQHMYGFESTILLALLNGGAFSTDRAFFPAEVIAGLSKLPCPRVLVTTPYHLGNILRTETRIVPADRLLSATAPLSVDLASTAEARFGCPLHEIYGSTETGQIAMRRTARGEEWQLFPGIRLDDHDDATWASGGHIEKPVPMGDRIEHRPDGRFRLLGRNADLINIAGKRSSLAYLDRQLHAIEGVEDGAFHMPPHADDEFVRPTAFVVAPTLAPGDILAALRERIDPLFLPRPLIMLEQLPRNATGKLPREARDALLAQARTAGGQGVV